MSGALIDFPIQVEKAKSARSLCNTCNRTIEKGHLRIGQQWNPDHTGNYYYHWYCFKKWPTNGSAPEEFLFGFERLSEQEKQKIKKVIADKVGAFHKTKGEKDTGKSPKKKVELESSESSDSEVEEGGDYYSMTTQRSSPAFGSTPKIPLQQFPNPLASSSQPSLSDFGGGTVGAPLEGDANPIGYSFGNTSINQFGTFNFGQTPPRGTPSSFGFVATPSGKKEKPALAPKSPMEKVKRKLEFNSPFSLQSEAIGISLESVLPTLCASGDLSSDQASWIQYIAPPFCRHTIDAALEVYSKNSDKEDLSDTLNRIHRIFSQVPSY